VKLGLIVEGHGEVTAMPVLLRRLAIDLGVSESLELPPALRIPKSKLVKPEELTRAVDLMARKTAPDGHLLIVLDADTDCPAELGPRLLAIAQQARSDRRLAVVVAKCEFETWFVAAAHSLRNQRGLPTDLSAPSDPENIRDAKGWLATRMSAGYSETLDQPALAAVFDWRLASATPSFDKLLRDLQRLWHIDSLQ
jgi:hypothetical protein